MPESGQVALYVLIGDEGNGTRGRTVRRVDGRRPGSGEAREPAVAGLPGCCGPFRTWPGASYGNRRPRRHRHQRSAPAPFGACRGTSA